MPQQQRVDRVFLNVAKEIATLSNCASYQVGCVIVNEGRIISQGYNGSPKGCLNCNEIFTDDHSWQRSDHHEFSEDFEIHAEQNAILYAAKHGISIDKSVIYCTLQPCKNCLKMICQSGAHRIVYGSPYDKSGYTQATYDMLELCGIELIHSQ